MLADGANALDLVHSVTRVLDDRMYGKADKRLMEEVAAGPLFDKVNGSLHGEYTDSFKTGESFLSPGNLQTSFGNNGMSVDIDIDLYRDPVRHVFGEVFPNHFKSVLNKVFGTNLSDKTNQDKVRRMLMANPQIGITPSTDKNFNRPGGDI